MEYKVLKLLLSQFSTLDERKKYADELGEEFWNVANDEMILLDERDFILYPLVRIGSQVWMAENLRYNYPSSYIIPNAPVEYERLYNWKTAIAVAPKGFHLPTDEEWNELEIKLGFSPSDGNDTGYRGKHGTGMKSTTGWSNNGNGDNSSAFNAFPAGDYASGSYYHLGGCVFFWSASEYGARNAWNRYLYLGNDGVSRGSINKSHVLSCRYVKDRNDE